MKVCIKVSQLMPDRTAYKKYSIMYQPEDLYLEVDVPVGMGSLSSDGQTVLNDDGLKWLAGHLADLVDDVDKEYGKKLQSNQ